MTLLPLLLLFAAAEPETATADAIMARVAENQNRAQEMRAAFVYHQNVMIRLQRSNGKLAREEYSEFTVTPTATGTQKQRILFRGKFADHEKEIEFDEPAREHKSIDIDADIANSLLDSFTNDPKSRDGIEHDLFPLTSKHQRNYKFHLEGSEDYRGIPVYRITFEPKKARFNEDNEDVWTGEVLVQRNEYQPVLVTTRLAAKVPIAVKTLLGTDIKQLGFKVIYQRFDEGLWFPVTYGGEFKLKVLFMYSRRIGVSMQNSDFQRAKVESKVSFAVP